jgi:electron transfer flavoprotein alpha/beta subunit
VTVDLRIVAPTSVYSLKTAATFKYNDGVRFAALPAIMAAKKKPLTEVKLAELAADQAQGHVREVPGAAGPQGRHQGEGRRSS